MMDPAARLFDAGRIAALLALAGLAYLVGTAITQQVAAEVRRSLNL